jgi:hypothetical protein
MKKFIILTISFSAMMIAVTYGQQNAQETRSSSVTPKIAKGTTVRTDSIKTKNSDDVVINMEMIESFRRCYDSIEVSPYTKMAGGYRADDMSIAILVAQKVKNEEAAQTQQALKIGDRPALAIVNQPTNKE